MSLNVKKSISKKSASTQSRISSSKTPQPTNESQQNPELTKNALASHPHFDMLQMQRTIGNRGVSNLIGTQKPIQTKLTVGPANDKYEQEADQVAKKVVRQINSPAAQQSVQPFGEPRAQRQGPEEEEELLQGKRLRRQPEEEEDLLQGKPIQRQPEEEEELLQGKVDSEKIQLQTPEEDEELLQGKFAAGGIQRQEEEEKLMPKPVIQRIGLEGGDIDSEIETAIHKERGSGQKLPGSVREPAENAFGADFSNVKIHTSSESDSLNSSLQSRAFTTGSHIFFKKEEYHPSSSRGQELIAHELTHVVQQCGRSRPSKTNPQRNGWLQERKSGHISGSGSYAFTNRYNMKNRNAIQRGFWDKVKKTGSSLWGGVKKTGNWLWKAVKFLYKYWEGANWLVALTGAVLGLIIAIAGFASGAVWIGVLGIVGTAIALGWVIVDGIKKLIGFFESIAKKKSAAKQKKEEQDERARIRNKVDKSETFMNLTEDRLTQAENDLIASQQKSEGQQKQIEKILAQNAKLQELLGNEIAQNLEQKDEIAQLRSQVEFLTKSFALISDNLTRHKQSHPPAIPPRKGSSTSL